MGLGLPGEYGEWRSADSKRAMPPLGKARFSPCVAMPVGAKLKVGIPGVGGCREAWRGKFLREVLEKEELRGVPIDIASGLSGPDIDIFRCLRLTEDLFLRTCGRGGTFMPPGEPGRRVPSGPVGIGTIAGVAGELVRTEPPPGLIDGIGDPEGGK
jgi:hypothetical protein